MKIGNIITLVGVALIAAGVLGGDALPWFVLRYSEIGLGGMEFNLGLAFLALCGLSVVFTGACLVTKDRALAASSTMMSMLTMFAMAYYVFEIRTILWGIDPLTGASLAPANEVVETGLGFTIVFMGALTVLVGTLVVFASDYKWEKGQALLRVAVILNGAIIDERILLEQNDLILGGQPKRSFFETGWFFLLFAAATFVLPALVFGPMIADFAAVRRARRHLHIPTGKFPEGGQIFLKDRDGNVQIGLTSEMDGKIHHNGEQLTVKQYVEGHTPATSGLNYGNLVTDDWGILEFDELSIFFQYAPNDQRVPRKSFWAFDRNVAATTLLSFLFQFGLIGSTILFWEETAVNVKQADIRKIMQVNVDTMLEEEEEEIIEEGEEEDTAAKKAAGEEGKFGDPDIDPQKDSKVPKRDGKMVDKIDVRDLGMNKLLSDSMNESLTSILDDNADQFQNKIAVAMSGTGSEFVLGHGSGGMGFKGTGTGGGGTGVGRIHGLASVDTGGGTAVTANLGKKRKKRISKLKLGSGASKGFCKRSNIQSVVRRRAGAIRACYERQLQIKPKLSGKLTVRWTINQEGRVDAAKVVKSTLKEKAVESCILRRMRVMRFQKPESGVCVIQWPFVFSSSG